MKTHIIGGGLLSLLATLAAGCLAMRPMTIPVHYTPTTTQRLSGAVSVTDFAYLPAKDGRVQANHLQNNGVFANPISKAIDIYVKEATTDELRRSGVSIDPDAKLELLGQVQEFRLDSHFSTAEFTYAVEYQIREARSGRVRFRQMFGPHKVETRKAINLQQISETLNSLVAKSYAQLAANAEVQRLLAE